MVAPLTRNRSWSKIDSFPVSCRMWVGAPLNLLEVPDLHTICSSVGTVKHLSLHGMSACVCFWRALLSWASSGGGRSDAYVTPPPTKDILLHRVRELETRDISSVCFPPPRVPCREREKETTFLRPSPRYRPKKSYYEELAHVIAFQYINTARQD